MPVLTDTSMTIEPFLRHVRALNRYNPSLYLPFYMAGVQVGLIRQAICPILATYPNIFRISDRVTFLPPGEAKTRSAALASVVSDLAKNGLLKMRGEAYPVMAGWGQELLATIDRGAYQFFGTLGFGVHANGLVRRDDGLYIWIARRGADLVVAPGKLDNIIGGGLGAGYSAVGTLEKEAAEEAGLSAEIIANAIPVSAIGYVHDTDDGVKRDTLFIYDLFLPESIVPENRDGEVERFELMPVEVAAALAAETNDFKANVNLVIADLLVRHGYFKPDMPGYVELVMGLHK